jgi:23S rRNA (adenine2503-C2)-methyltransferase
VVSTSGVIPKIKQFTDEKRKFKLAISLNATTDDVRDKLMPLNKKWPLRDLIASARDYTEKLNQPVTFEYVLLNGVNDSAEDAERLKKLVGHLFCKVNLIPYNPTIGDYKRSSDSDIRKFYEKMADLKVPVTVRWSSGGDIDAGCGQLATKVG